MSFHISATHSEAEIAEIASTSRGYHHSKMVGVDPYVAIAFLKQPYMMMGSIFRNTFKLDPSELNKLPEDVFEIVSKVGEGSYGSVHKALHKSSGHTLAIKKVPVDTDLQEIIKEVRKQLLVGTKTAPPKTIPADHNDAAVRQQIRGQILRLLLQGWTKHLIPHKLQCMIVD